MRERKEIEQDVKNKVIKSEDLICELLLDIRELLQKND